MSMAAEAQPDYPQTSAETDRADESYFAVPRVMPFHTIEHLSADQHQLLRRALVAAAAGATIGWWVTRPNRALANYTKLRI